MYVTAKVDLHIVAYLRLVRSSGAKPGQNLVKIEQNEEKNGLTYVCIYVCIDMCLCVNIIWFVELELTYTYT